jgi:uncharacterized repeat protein (TIGR02543 family)
MKKTGKRVVTIILSVLMELSMAPFNTLGGMGVPDAEIYYVLDDSEPTLNDTYEVGLANPEQGGEWSGEVMESTTEPDGTPDITTELQEESCCEQQDGFDEMHIHDFKPNITIPETPNTTVKDGITSIIATWWEPSPDMPINPCHNCDFDDPLIQHFVGEFLETGEKNGYYRCCIKCGGLDGQHKNVGGFFGIGSKPCPLTTYTIKFDATGGSVYPTSAQTGTDDRLSSLPTPVRDGYGFSHWRAYPRFEVVTTSSVFTYDMEITAQWNRLPPPQPRTLTESNPTAGILHIREGASQRIPITITSPLYGAVIVQASSHPFTSPALYNASGVRIAHNGAGWRYTVPAGQTVTIYAGEYYNKAISYAVHASFPVDPLAWTLTSPWASNGNNMVFGSVAEGYSEQSERYVTIGNSGPTRLVDVAASITAGNSYFEITTLTPGWTYTINVRPKMGLSAGTYNGTLTVSTSNGGSKTMPLSFTVVEPFLTVDTETWNAAPAATSTNIRVTSNVSWAVSVSEEWLSASRSIIINAAANTSTSARTGTVTVEGGGISRTITVTQAPGAVILTPEQPTATVHVDDGISGRIPVTITAPSYCDITVASRWNLDVGWPALYDASGSRINQLNSSTTWKFTIPAGQTMTIYAGEHHNIATIYTVTAMFPTASTITLAECNPTARVDIVAAGAISRIPITVTAPLSGDVIIQSSGVSSPTPVLYNAAGTRIASSEAGHSHFRYTVPAGQTMTVFAGTWGDVAGGYTVTAIFPAPPIILTQSNPTATVNVGPWHSRVPITVTALPNAPVTLRSDSGWLPLPCSNCAPALYSEDGPRIAHRNFDSRDFTFTVPAGQTMKVFAGTGGCSAARTYTVTATFPENTVTVTWNPDGGTMASASSSLRPAWSFYTLPAPTRAGFTFGGWFTGANGTGAQITDISIVPGVDTTYYAKWTEGTSTITLTRNNPTEIVNVGAGADGRVPITVTAPFYGSVTLRGTPSWYNIDAPALYTAEGARFSSQTFDGVRHSFTFTVRAGQTMTVFAGTWGDIARSYAVTATFPVAIPEISVSSIAPNFGSHVVGYTQQPAQTITITNTGTTHVTLDALPTIANWTLTQSADWIIPFGPGQTRTFTVRPNSRLSAGTYDSKIILSGSGGVGAEIQLKFAVEHSFADDFTIDIPATCTADGSQSKHCKRTGCDAKYETTKIPMTGHSFTNYIIVTSPTCETPGSETAICDHGCEITDIRSIEALGHNYADYFTVDVPATCMADGSQSKHCQRTGCDAKDETTEIPATGHSFTNYIKVASPTYEADGNETAYCDHGCGASSTRLIPAFSHDMPADWTERIPADCATEGLEYKACSHTDCGYEIIQPIAVLGHDYADIWTIDTLPTCTIVGLESRHCTRMGCTEKTGVREISTLGHEWGKWAVAITATATTTGEERRMCVRSGCKEFETREIPATDIVSDIASPNNTMPEQPAIPEQPATLSQPATPGHPSVSEQPSALVPGFNVIVDDEPLENGTVETIGGVTTVTVNQEFILQQIDASTDNITIIIPAQEETGIATAVLIMQNVDDMAEREMTLIIQVNNVQYKIPATAIDTAAILAALGAQSAADIPIGISITTNVNAATQAKVNSTINRSGSMLVTALIKFSITATYSGQTVEITTFNQFVGRTVEITADQAAQITTAVVIQPDGTMRQVPTRVFRLSDKWFAEFNSLTNSIYALISNEVAFSDSRGKWFEATVNEMGSRRIIAGIGNGLFAGDRDITRAEFAAIVIQALGLPTNVNSAVFTNIPASAWYAGIVGTAYEYGIIEGIGNYMFAPDRKITREEAMVIIWRMARIAGFEGNDGNLNAFSDAGNVSGWALDATKWNVGSGLATGREGGFLAPTDNITRAEAAMLVFELMRQAGLVDARDGQPLTQTTEGIDTFFATLPKKENDLLGDGDVWCDDIGASPNDYYKMAKGSWQRKKL